MAKKNLEKAIEKKFKPYVPFLIIGIFIGFVAGFAILFLLPQKEYRFELNGNEIIQISDISEYSEEGISVTVNGKTIDISEHLIIDGTIEEKIGTYILQYRIKDIKALKDVILQRVIIIKGQDVVGEPTELDNYE